MSRSYRKTPIFGASTSLSDKQDKRYANRAYRRSVNQELDDLKENPELFDEMDLPIEKEISDPWNFSKDGKRYWVPRIEDNDWIRSEHLDRVVNKPHWWNRSEQERWERMMRK